LFFAKKIILVEGATEKTVIPLLAEQIKVFKYDYTIIECGSKDSMIPYIILFNKFSIPYTVAYDKDHQDYKGIDAKNSADISSEKIEAKINSSLGKSIIFINDIEEEIGISQKDNKNKPYFALNQISSSDFVLNDILKNKIKEMYE